MGSLCILGTGFTTSFRAEFTIVFRDLHRADSGDCQAGMPRICETASNAVKKNKILVRQIKAVNAKLLQLAYKDPLTSLSIARQFEERTRHGFWSSLMGQLQASRMMLVDVDNFKQVNDNWTKPETNC